jgi:hypothetical protein
MRQTFSRLFAAPLAAVVLASFALTPATEAATRGGGDRAPAGGGKPTAQVSSAKADSRSNNVRSTSVNNVNNTNVNVNKNVNVNVQQQGGCCNNGWDNDHHPVAVAAAVTATAVVIGSLVAAPPPGCVPVNYGGMVYQQCGATWYQPQGSQFVVVNPPY